MELEDPVVYFVVSLSSDKEPKEIIEGIGGNGTGTMERRCFSRK